MKIIMTVCLTILTLALVIAGGGCSPKTTEPQVTIDLAPIHDISITLLKSNPPQVNVHIQGGLADGCTTFHDIQTTRESTTITLKVTTQRPKDAICTEIYTWFEKDVNLGSNFTIGQVYTVKVNDQTTTFSY